MKWLHCLRSGVDMCEMPQIRVKWLRYVINGFHVSEEAERSGKLLMNVRKGLSMWEITQICMKWLHSLKNGVDMCETA